MGLFNKKESVPELPSAPNLPELPKSPNQPEKKNMPELPSFPANPKNENFNQEMVKSAVADQPTLGEKEGDIKVPEVSGAANAAGGSMLPPRPFAATAPVAPESSTPTGGIDALPPVVAQSAIKTNEPIFVRIDKFQDSQENFEDIKDKIDKIEEVLNRIKEVKVREEEELRGWTEDVEKIKSKLGEIDSDIFSQI